jgi:ribose transport system substrate-binding protein
MDTKLAAEEAAEALGIAVEWVAPYEANTAGQVEIMHWLINRGVDGILVSCNDPEALRPVIDRGIEQGVHIATFDSDSPNSNRIFYVGTDNYHAGYDAGEALIDVVQSNEGLRTRSPGTTAAADRASPVETVIISGRPEAHNLNQRIAGFRDAVREGLSFELVDILYCDDDITRSVELTEHIVRSREGVDAIFFTGGWPFLAPVDSMNNYRSWLDAGGSAVTMDAHHPILVAAADGMVDGVVGQSFDAMGRIGVETLYKAIKGEKVDGLIYTPTFRVTTENFDEHLARARNYELK